MGNNYSEVSNAINDVPLSLGNIESDFKNMDLITPNQLKLGRNNKVVRNHLKILGENKKIFSIWFEGWYYTFQNWWSMVPQWLRCENLWCGFIYQKWRFSGEYISIWNGSWNRLSEGGLIWKVFIKYRNISKSTDCFATCAVRALVLIHPVDKLHTMGELETLLQ